jgi:tripartite-type tricarboxylate transporter receptor subunit TctC
MKKNFTFLLATLLCSISVVAQTAYPIKPVKLMVGAGAGGGTDIIARRLKKWQSLSKALLL